MGAHIFCGCSPSFRMYYGGIIAFLHKTNRRQRGQRMAREWFFQDGDQVLGPLMPADLRRLLQQGRINPDTPIRKGAEGKWLRAAKVPGLLDPVAAPAAPAVVPV